MADEQVVRELRFRLKRANSTQGRQGDTIHLLRSELAYVRQQHSKLERGELQRLENLVERLADRSAETDMLVQKQRELIAELQSREVVDAEVVEHDVVDAHV